MLKGLVGMLEIGVYENVMVKTFRNQGTGIYVLHRSGPF